MKDQVAAARDKIGEIFLAPGEKLSAEHAQQIDSIIKAARRKSSHE